MAKKEKDGFKGIPWLMAELKALSGDLTKNTKEENKELAARANELLELFNEGLSDIRVSLIKTEYKIRRCLLAQITSLAKNNGYDEISLEECWDDFVLAHKYNYGSFGWKDTGWSGEKIAGDAVTLLYPILIEKLRIALSGNLSDEEKDRCLLMLRGIKARFNWGKLEYRFTQTLLENYDPENKFEHKWI